MQRYTLTHFDDVPPIACPCGSTRRAFADEPDRTASVHLLTVKTDSQVHYHKKLTEFYYVLEGQGHVELDGRRFPIRPGHAIKIRPLCRHRAVGQLTILVMPVPAFDPADEYTDSQPDTGENA